MDLHDTAPEFELEDVLTGRTVRSSDYEGQPLLVVFTCVHCPYAVHVQHELARLGRDLAERGVGMLAICSNDVERYPQDGPDGMRRQAAEAGWSFPYLHDPEQRVAVDFGAACTPDPFLFDVEHRLVYRGRLDASRPGSEFPATADELRAAVAAVLRGEQVPTPHHPAMGCSIKWRESVSSS